MAQEKWHHTGKLFTVIYTVLLFSKSASTTLLKCFKAVVHHIVKPRGGGFPSGWTEGNIFWVLSATLSLEGVYLFRCPPQLGTWQAPHGREDLFGMNALTVGAGGTKLWLHDGPRKKDRGSLWLCGENQQYGCCLHRGWSIGGRSRPWLEVGRRSRPWPSGGGRRRGLNGPVHRRHRLWLFNK